MKNFVQCKERLRNLLGILLLRGTLSTPLTPSLSVLTERVSSRFRFYK